MKDYKKLQEICLSEVVAVGIEPGNIIEWQLNSRAKSRWGQCTRNNKTKECKIQIAAQLIYDDRISEKACKETIIHEILHTCNGAKGHTGLWKQYADKINTRYGYNIKRTTSGEEKGVENYKSTFIACYELIQLIISYNNLANFETWFIFKWIFKTFVAVELITHTFDFTMAIFEVAQTVVTNAGGIISGTTAVDASTLASMQSTVEAMDIGPLLCLLLQTWIIQLFTLILSVVIYVIVNARMIEIYLMVSLAPIPFSTFGNKDQSMIGQNYVRSLFALGFQGFLIMVCVGIYAVLIQSAAFTTDIVGSLWKVLGFTILLAFTLFKTGAVAKSVLHAH